VVARFFFGAGPEKSPGVGDSPLLSPLFLFIRFRTENEKITAVRRKRIMPTKIAIPPIIVSREGWTAIYPPIIKNGQKVMTEIRVNSRGLQRLLSRGSSSLTGKRSIISPRRRSMAESNRQKIPLIATPKMNSSCIDIPRVAIGGRHI
jgi:hypothetical protein